MKNLHKKISAIVLSGMIISSGYFAKGLNIYAYNINNDLDRYSKLLYNVELPKSKYLHGIAFAGLSGSNDDEQIKKQIKEINEICEDKILKPIQLSSEYGQYDNGKLRGIPGFLDGIKEGVKKGKGGEQFLKECCKYFFDDIDDFRKYLEENSEFIESGVYRIQVGSVEGVYVARGGGIDVGEVEK